MQATNKGQEPWNTSLIVEVLTTSMSVCLSHIPALVLASMIQSESRLAPEGAGRLGYRPSQHHLPTPYPAVPGYVER
jgi:hypothetical protein